MREADTLRAPEDWLNGVPYGEQVEIKPGMDGELVRYLTQEEK